MRLYRLVEGEYFVRGTQDLNKVCALMEDDEYIQDDAPEDEDWKVTITDFDKGLWRFVPCAPQWCGEHSWHVNHARKPGRGVFEGVLVRSWSVDEIEYFEEVV